MHANPDLRMVLEWEVAGSSTAIADVIWTSIAGKTIHALPHIHLAVNYPANCRLFGTGYAYGRATKLAGVNARQVRIGGGCYEHGQLKA